MLDLHLFGSFRLSLKYREHHGVNGGKIEEYVKWHLDLKDLGNAGSETCQ